MAERKEGWYWVKFSGTNEPWECAQWEDDGWWTAGNDQHIGNNLTVGPRIPTPDEPWHCVPASPTSEMTEAAEEGHMPFGDMGFAIQCAIVNAPKPEDV